MTDPIAVLAGTPVDTRMGVDCLTGRGLSGLSFPLSKDPREQTAFQYAAPAEKQRPRPGDPGGRRLPGLPAGLCLLQLPGRRRGFPVAGG